MIKKIIVISLLMCLFGGVNAQYDAKAKIILEKVTLKYSSMKAYSVDFVNKLHSPLAGIDEETKGSIIISGDKFRLNLEGQEVIVDGKTMWTYLKDDNEVNISDYDAEDSEMNPGSIYKMWKKGYKYRLLEKETINAKKYNVIELTPENPENQFFKVKLWVDVNNYTIKKWKMFEKNGNRYEYVIDSFKANYPAKIATFKFDKSKHSGVIETDLRD